jgi:signal transduction histidine kinase
MDEGKIKLLEEAIQSFNTTSAELEKSYRLLEEQVRQLKEELEVKNKALAESTAEKEHLREQAERNNRLAAVGEMSARMAHELRNPLGSIELFAALLQKGLTSDPEKQAWAKHISTAVEAMDYALSNLLFFTGKPKPQFKKTEIQKVIDEAAGFAVHLLQQKEITLTVPSIGPAVSILCDEDLLRQVFLNLILNAVDALSPHGHLTISVKPLATGVSIEVRDTGCGIPQNQFFRIFDPFYTTKNKGSGLGLAIVHNAVAAHRGTITVESEEGKGSCFKITLPANPEAVEK